MSEKENIHESAYEGFSHLDVKGQAHMVDVGSKQVSTREASAQAVVRMNSECYKKLKAGEIEKGDVLSTARIAGIQAAKKTADLIPLCHPLLLSHIELSFSFQDDKQSIMVESKCALSGKTGVEMEALTAASIAALTIYDMCKALDKAIVIEGLCLLKKTGGKSGEWRRL